MSFLAGNSSSTSLDGRNPAGAGKNQWHAAVSEVARLCIGENLILLLSVSTGTWKEQRCVSRGFKANTFKASGTSLRAMHV